MNVYGWRPRDASVSQRVGTHGIRSGYIIADMHCIDSNRKQMWMTVRQMVAARCLHYSYCHYSCCEEDMYYDEWCDRRVSADRSIVWVNSEISELMSMFRKNDHSGPKMHLKATRIPTRAEEEPTAMVTPARAKWMTWLLSHSSQKKSPSCHARYTIHTWSRQGRRRAPDS